MLPFVPETSSASEQATPLREQSKFTMLHFICLITSFRLALLQEKLIILSSYQMSLSHDYHTCLTLRRTQILISALRSAIPTEGFCTFLNPSKQMLGLYLKTCHNHFLLHTFQFIIHNNHATAAI